MELNTGWMTQKENQSQDMNKRYPIRMSKWHCLIGKKKTKVVIENIVVSGDRSDILAISRSSVYLVRLYKEYFGDKYKSYLNKNELKVIRIELSDNILGMGVGCLSESTETKK